MPANTSTVVSRSALPDSISCPGLKPGASVPRCNSCCRSSPVARDSIRNRRTYVTCTEDGASVNTVGTTAKEKYEPVSFRCSINRCQPNYPSQPYATDEMVFSFLTATLRLTHTSLFKMPFAEHLSQLKDFLTVRSHPNNYLRYNLTLTDVSL